MGHITFWSIFTILIYWAETYISQEKQRSCIRPSKEISLQVNTEKTSICSCFMNTVQGTANKSLENVESSKYLETIIKDKKRR
jgi:hypothetical protein